MCGVKVLLCALGGRELERLGDRCGRLGREHDPASGDGRRRVRRECNAEGSGQERGLGHCGVAVTVLCTSRCMHRCRSSGGGSSVDCLSGDNRNAGGELACKGHDALGREGTEFAHAAAGGHTGSCSSGCGRDDRDALRCALGCSIAAPDARGEGGKATRLLLSRRLGFCGSSGSLCCDSRWFGDIRGQGAGRRRSKSRRGSLCQLSKHVQRKCAVRCEARCRAGGDFRCGTGDDDCCDVVCLPLQLRTLHNRLIHM